MNKKFFILLCFLSSNVFAQTLGTIATDFLNYIPGILSVSEGVSYIFSVGFFIKSLFKLKEYVETKGQQVKLHTPIIYFISAAFLFGLPSFISMGVDTFGFNSNGSVVKFSY